MSLCRRVVSLTLVSAATLLAGCGQSGMSPVGSGMTIIQKSSLSPKVAAAVPAVAKAQAGVINVVPRAANMRGTGAITMAFQLPQKKGYRVQATSADIQQIQVSLQSNGTSVATATVTQAQLVNGTASVNFDQLAAGSYSVAINAQNFLGLNIGKDIESVSVVAGQVTPVNAQLQLVADTAGSGAASSTGVAVNIQVIDGAPSTTPTPLVTPTPVATETPSVAPSLPAFLTTTPAPVQSSATPVLGTPFTWSPSFASSSFAGTGFAGAAIDRSYTHEMQTYQPNMVDIENGNLVIHSDHQGNSYPSGWAQTKGKFEFLYGHVDVTAKLPAGQGMWPAIWLLPADGSWPPEIDMMEMLGNDPTTVYETEHYGANWTDDHANGVPTHGSVDYSQGFHTFSLDWQPNDLKWYIDGQLVNEVTTNICQKPMYLIINNAVGGDWPGAPNSSTVFPSQMLVSSVTITSTNVTTYNP